MFSDCDRPTIKLVRVRVFEPFEQSDEKLRELFHAIEGIRKERSMDLQMHVGRYMD